MRKIFILLLLGIICMSTFSSLLSEYVQDYNPEKLLLTKVGGYVGAGNFSYWQSMYPGPLLIELTSLKGDADLYISDTSSPSYETDKNNFSSITCGTDTVHVPADFPRPIGIGIFGHWTHTLSEYNIKVFADSSPIHNTMQHYFKQDFRPTEFDLSHIKKNFHHRNNDENKPSFHKLLKFLDSLFDMIIL